MQKPLLGLFDPHRSGSVVKVPIHTSDRIDKVGRAIMLRDNNSNDLMEELGSQGSTRPAYKPVGRLLLLVFAVLFGLLAALIRGYGYGMTDQEVHIPEILRILDSGYLVNDFVLNSASDFGPRFYYSHAVALTAKVVPLEATFAILFLLQSIAASCITALAAEDITGSSIAGMVAVVLVMSLIPLHFGSTASVLWFTVVPSFLALPFSMFAIWMAVSDKPIYVAVAIVPAILIHPMVGLQGAMIALVAVTIRRVFMLRVQEDQTGNTLRLFAPLILASLIISVETILFWVLPALRTNAILTIETEEFVQIIAHFRHPGNLVPSTWPITKYLLMGMFTFVVISAFVMLWRHGSETVERCEHRARQLALGTVFAAIILALTAGYVFVEVIPTRVVTQAYVFRMVPVFIWLGWILIAYSIAMPLSQGRSWRSILSMASTLSPLTLFLFNVVTLVSGKFHRIWKTQVLQSYVAFMTLLALLVVGGTAVSVLTGNPVRAAMATLIIPGFIAIVVIVKRPEFAKVALLGIASLLALATTVFATDRLDILPEIRLSEGSPFPDKFENVSVIAYLQPVLSTGETMDSPRCRCDDVAELAAVARRETEPGAVFLIPSNWRNWRMFAERAVVVDGKFMPFRDEGMLEWYKRHIDIYDSDSGVGYPENVTEPELFGLRDRYGFDYAVLPIHTETELPVLGQTERWKLVHMKES